MNDKKEYSFPELSQIKKELSSNAYDLFFRCFLTAKFDFIYDQFEIDLFSKNPFKDIRFNFPYKISIETFKEVLDDYLRIKKRFLFLKISDTYPIHLVPLEKLSPPQKTFKNKIRSIYIYNSLGGDDFYYWLRRAKPDFYENKKEISQSILNGFRNAKQIYNNLLAQNFEFTYTGVLTNPVSDFSKKNHNKNFHLNDILELKNYSLEPVIFFGGGLGDHFGFEMYIPE